MTHRSNIGGITVAATSPVIVYGSVRGLVSQHRTLERARSSLLRDQAGCRNQGGYSDARIYEWREDLGWWPRVCGSDLDQ